jgi:hypothetical protein
MSDAIKALKKGRRVKTFKPKKDHPPIDLRIPGPREYSTENPECFESSQVKLDPKRDNNLRAGMMNTMRRRFKEQLIDAAKSGSLLVKDRMTRLPCPVKSPEDENLVSLADLNAYLLKAGLDQLDDATDGDFIHRVHVTANRVFAEEKGNTGKTPTKTRVAKLVAEELRDVPGKRGKPVRDETIRRTYLKDWKEPKV